MQSRHVPAINARYWAGITLASIFGTNMGDFYAHESGLGLIRGLPILVILFLLVYAVERFDKLSHDAYYWICIIVMRTGATNIADFAASRLRIGLLALSIGLGAVLAALAWWTDRDDRRLGRHTAPKALPDTDVRYWAAMLTAGVLGTALGDYFEHLLGDGRAAVGLAVVLAGMLFVYGRGVLTAAYGYWLTIAVARTTGTAIGDWLAGNRFTNIGLPLCTLMTGLALAAVLIAWRRRRTAEPAPAV